MSLQRVKLLGLLGLAALFAVEGVYLLTPDHNIASYIKWGYPPWLHILVGAWLIVFAMLLPFRRSRWLGAVIGGCFIVLETTTALLHGDFAHAAQGLLLLILFVWLVRPSSALERPQ